MATWLEGARAARGGLLIAGGPNGRGADFLLLPDDVRVSIRGVEVSLPWHTYSPQATAGERWAIGGWGAGNYGFLGVGLDGPASLDPVRRASRSLRNRLLAWNPYHRFIQPRSTVPLWAPPYRSSITFAQQSTVAALCAVLADQPTVRQVLADVPRVTKLASDIAAHSLTPNASSGFSTTEAAVVAALQALGYQHRYLGRPLPGARLGDIDEVVQHVMQRLSDNPYGPVNVSLQRADELVAAHYLQVEPWPFAALGV